MAESNVSSLNFGFCCLLYDSFLGVGQKTLESPFGLTFLIRTVECIFYWLNSLAFGPFIEPVICIEEDIRYFSFDITILASVESK